MKAIQILGRGKATRLVIGEVPPPEPGPGEVRIRVYATAVNRADLMQRQGSYPPPPGASEILGLECAGVVDELGGCVEEVRRGDRVMALLPGGGYAEKTLAHEGSLLPVPKGMKFEQAAAIPEVFLTAYLNLFELGRIQEGDWALVHGGGSGVGTAAIQLLRQAGVRVVVTCGSAEKGARCVQLGAATAINYRQEAFASRVMEITGGEGVDVVLDHIGAPYLEQNLSCLKTGGRLLQIGLMGGAETKISLTRLLMRRLQLIGSTLRGRSAEQKAGIVQRFLSRFGADLETGAIHPVVDRVLPLARAQEAHEVLQQSVHFGKVVLLVHSG